MIMKQFNKQILEAVHRGIKLALDDYQDIDPNSSISSTNDIIDAEDYIADRIDFEKFSKRIHSCNSSSYVYSNILLIKAIHGMSKICKRFPFKFKPKNKLELQYIIDVLIKDNQNANLNWLDVSEITNMERLFMNKPFNGNVSEWNVSNVTNMHSMFYGSYFNGDISKWNVINVVKADQMFAHSKFNSYIGDWRFRSLESGGEMFWGTDFNQDISKWDYYIQFDVLRDLLVGANKLYKKNKPLSQRIY